MGQIRGEKAHIDACNLRSLSLFGTPAAGQHILVSTDNSAMQNGQGNFDAYVVGNGRDAATALELKKINTADNWLFEDDETKTDVSTTWTNSTIILSKGNNVGNTYGSSGFSASDYIDLDGYDKIKFTAVVNNTESSSVGACFYNASKQAVQGINFFDTSLASREYQEKILPIPSGCRYIRTTKMNDTNVYGNWAMSLITSNGVKFVGLTKNDVVDDLENDSADKVLSAKQGKKLNNLATGLEPRVDLQMKGSSSSNVWIYSEKIFMPKFSHILYDGCGLSGEAVVLLFANDTTTEYTPLVLGKGNTIHVYADLYLDGDYYVQFRHIANYGAIVGYASYELFNKTYLQGIGAVSYELFANIDVLTAADIRAKEARKNGLMIFEDDFDVLSERNWNYEKGYIRHIGSELQYYRKDNCLLLPSMVFIYCNKEGEQWYSSSLCTQDRFHFGDKVRIDIKAKMDAVDGLWPALWTYGADYSQDGSVDYYDQGEIDIMESFGVGAFQGGLHIPNGDGTITPSAKVNYTNRRQWHLYSVVRDGDKIELYFDDALMGTYNLQTAANQRIASAPHKLIMNVALSNTYGSVTDANQGTGMWVDYVRIYSIDASKPIIPTSLITDADTYNVAVGDSVPIVTTLPVGTIDKTVLYDIEDTSIVTNIREAFREQGDSSQSKSRFYGLAAGTTTAYVHTRYGIGKTITINVV